MEILGFAITSPIAWIIVAVLLAIIEAITLGISTIWFSIGAVVASIISIAGGNILLQIIAFLIVSILLLYFTRPLAVKKLKIGSVKTNVDTLIGETAIVTKDVIPYETGQVRVQGQIWTAVVDGRKNTLLKGATVRILRVEGVKLVVEPVENNEKTEEES